MNAPQIDTHSYVLANSARILDAVNALTDICHTANSTWWIDTETGQDVRAWHPKILNLWIASKLMLIVTEVAESMEGLRKNLADDKLPQFQMRDVELVDAIIRICDLLGGLRVAAGNITVAKMLFNARRPDHKIENRQAVGGKSI